MALLARILLACCDSHALLPTASSPFAQLRGYRTSTALLGWDTVHWAPVHTPLRLLPRPPPPSSSQPTPNPSSASSPLPSLFPPLPYSALLFQPTPNPASSPPPLLPALPPQHALQLELGNLLVRLRQYPAATAAINKALERNRDGLPATENLQLDVEA
mgnify:CR=1 FL=1